jgi:hypothetical protein
MFISLRIKKVKYFFVMVFIYQLKYELEQIQELIYFVAEIWTLMPWNKNQ